MIRLLIADDHAILRQGLSSLLGNCEGIEVVGEAADGDAVVAQVDLLQPDVLILDISMPGPGLLQVLDRVRRRQPAIRVLILSTHAEDQYAIRALKAGADGYLTKERSSDELELAVRRVAAGRKFVSAELAEHMASELFNANAGQSHQSLSDREFEVLVCIGKGLSVNQTGEELSLSPKTVHTYRARIFEKTGLKTDADIIRYALQNKLVQ